MESQRLGERDTPIRVGVLSPGGAIRAGLRALLQSDDGVDIIFEAAHLAELMHLDESVEVLVAVLSIRQLSELGQALPQDNPLAVLLLSSDWEEAGNVPLPPPFYNRAIGLLPVGVDGEILQAALFALAAGLSVGLPGWFNRLSDGSRLYLSPPEGEERLTPREGHVLEHLAQGLTNKQIALALGISEHTVKYHISAIYAKLGVMNRAEAVRVGTRRGYLRI
jgi:DNA-binding NarL/FixJ family response regulator